MPGIAEAKAGKKIKNAPVVTLDNGAKYQDVTLGEGAEPIKGDRVAIHYSLFCNGIEARYVQGFVRSHSF